MARLTPSELGLRRLRAQHVGGARFAQPHDVVRWLVAVQAQEPLAARWAVGARLPGSTEAQIVAALDRGDVLRTHLMRGTWQYVVPDDLPWLLELLGTGVRSKAARRHRDLELDEKTFSRAESVLTKALAKGAAATRETLREALEGAGVATEAQRLSHLLVELELRGLLCSGPHVDGAASWCLLEHRVSAAAKTSREEALATLARRYFESRGPATLGDFRWWTGLSAADAKAGHEAVRRELESTSTDGVTWWWSGDAAEVPAHALLPAFDEFLVSYQGRDEVLDPVHVKRINAGGGLLSPCLVDGGRVVGVWRRELAKAHVEVTTSWFSPPSRARANVLQKSVEGYARFLGLSLRRG